MFLAASKETAEELGECFGMRVMRLMADHRQNRTLSGWQRFLKFFEAGPGHNSVFITLSQQDGCLDCGEDGAKVEARDQIKPVGKRADRRAGVLLKVVLPAVVDHVREMQAVVICQNCFVQGQSAGRAGEKAAEFKG